MEFEKDGVVGQPPPPTLIAIIPVAEYVLELAFEF